jgi:hypothetical protein
VRKHRKLLIALVCSTTLVVNAADEEPAYQGRTLSEWTRDFDPHVFVQVGHEPPSWKAMYNIGTNAIPILLKWMAEPDPPEPPKTNLAPCFTLSRSARAAMALRVLGNTASPAIPKLTTLALTTKEAERAEECMRTLAYLGPGSLSGFITVLTNGAPDRRFSALSWLPAVDGDLEPALPAIMSCLVGIDEDLSWKTASELSHLKIPPSTIVPALTNALTSASTPARCRILRTLLWLNYPAREALPAVRAALSDADGQVRQEAAWTLERIAPKIPTVTPSK